MWRNQRRKKTSRMVLVWGVGPSDGSGVEFRVQVLFHPNLANRVSPKEKIVLYPPSPSGSHPPDVVSRCAANDYTGPDEPRKW